MTNNSRVRLSDLPCICFYCGDPAGDREHVFPRSVFAERGFKVWSCRECNVIASNKVFDTIEEKAYFIKKALEKKYSYLFDFPDWADDEIDELGYSLRQAVTGYNNKQNWVYKRIKWSTSLNVLIAARYLQDHNVGEGFLIQKAASHGIRGHEMRALVDFSDSPPPLAPKHAKRRSK